MDGDHHRSAHGDARRTLPETSKWFANDDLPSERATEMFAEIDDDPTCIFWG